MFPSRNPVRHVRRSAMLMVAGSALLLAGFLLHPAEYVDSSKTAQSIADHAGTWALAHWLLAIGGLALAVAAGILAKARYGPTRHPFGRVAWAALAVSAMLAIEIFVLEATVAVSYGKAGNATGLQNLMVPEIPGIIGLFGLSAAGAAVFVQQTLDDCPLLPKAVNAIAALGAITGLVGTTAFGLGSDALATLQYGTGVLLLGLMALGIRALVESSPRRTAAPSNQPKLG